MSSKTASLDPAVRDYLLGHGVREDEVLRDLRAETGAMPEANMQISPEQGAFLGVLTRAVGARRILEIGTFTGYSSLVFARALPTGGTIDCCDVSEQYTAVADRYWRRAGVREKVHLWLAPALQTVERFLAEGRAGTYDLAFVDADKESYPRYHDPVLELLRPGGVLLYDNVLWSGRVADPSDTRATTVAIRELNARVAADPRLEISMLPLSDGLTVCVKR